MADPSDNLPNRSHTRPADTAKLATLRCTKPAVHQSPQGWVGGGPGLFVPGHRQAAANP